ncbi:MAG: hypothetical protein KZQ58_10120 [gamma proteobacterium symbiont of Bathyaustriella thionipta]|nr:hypothetical protein [gamma proteobacterium symbiont of Bathyaustriella thionipta]
MPEYQQLFSRSAEALLAGEIICNYRTPEIHAFLSEQANEVEMEGFLRKIGRRLTQTADQSSWFAIYRDMESETARRAISAQFNQVINNLEPLVIWLQMSSTFASIGTPIRAGDTLKTGELLLAIESAPALCEDLEKLSKTKLFSNNQSSSKGQLDSILKKLVDEQYLIPAGRAQSQYIASGKWSRLYDLLEFIAAHEQLEIETDEAEQGELEGL